MKAKASSRALPPDAAPLRGAGEAQTVMAAVYPPRCWPAVFRRKGGAVLEKANINWQYPPPRKGLLGALDRFIGPGATSAEIWLQIVPSVLAGIGAPVYAILNGVEWNIVQLVLAGLFAFDMMGGIVTNATSTAKRWYHRKGQGFGHHFAFTGVHAVHLFLVAWLFRSQDWGFFGATTAYLLVASVIILKSPLYLRRPLAYLLYAIALLVSIYGFAPTVGLEWFLPFFYLKLLVSHLLREEPYRPLSET